MATNRFQMLAAYTLGHTLIVWSPELLLWLVVLAASYASRFQLKNGETDDPQRLFRRKAPGLRFSGAL